MEFKIDTKPNYTLIQSDSKELNVNMAEALRQKVKELSEKDSRNFIIDLKNCLQIELEAGNILLDLHNRVYESEGSLVFTNLEDEVLQTLKKEQLHLSLNLSPTQIEAVDIISMEILERNLLNES
jgi:anti-anti-sigma factor